MITNRVIRKQRERGREKKREEEEGRVRKCMIKYNKEGRKEGQ